MNPKQYRGLEKIIGRKSYLATLVREDLIKQGHTELDDVVVEQVAEIHSEQIKAVNVYMRKDTKTI